jgi:hypothetical protein
MEVCVTCRKKFKTKQSCQQHADAVHKRLPLVAHTKAQVFNSNMHSIKQPIKCGICGINFPTEHSLQQHKEHCFECHVCGIKFTIGHHLAQHLDDMHTYRHSKRQSYHCGICRATLYST